MGEAGSSCGGGARTGCGPARAEIAEADCVEPNCPLLRQARQLRREGTYAVRPLARIDYFRCALTSLVSSNVIDLVFAEDGAQTGVGVDVALLLASCRLCF